MISKIVITEKGTKAKDAIKVAQWFVNRFGYVAAKAKLKNQYGIKIALEVIF